jgi:FtsZ-binding cell division protein ZapB
MEGFPANESASEMAIGRVRENWQNRVEKLKAKKNEISTKLQAKRSNQNKGELQALKNQYQEQVRTEFQQFQGEMKDAVKARYENWQNTLDKKFDKWEARVEKAKKGNNSEEVKFLQTEIKRLKENLQVQLGSVEASRQAIENLRNDNNLWVAEHQAEWQSHKNNLREFKDNMMKLNEYLRALKDLLQ